MHKVSVLKEKKQRKSKEKEKTGSGEEEAEDDDDDDEGKEPGVSLNRLWYFISVNANTILMK